jgi:hypothetical protein
LFTERSQRGGIEPALASTQPDVGGIGGVLTVKRVEVTVEQLLERPGI